MRRHKATNNYKKTQNTNCRKRIFTQQREMQNNFNCDQIVTELQSYNDQKGNFKVPQNTKYNYREKNPLLRDTELIASETIQRNIKHKMYISLGQNINIYNKCKKVVCAKYKKR